MAGNETSTTPTTVLPGVTPNGSTQGQANAVQAGTGMPTSGGSSGSTGTTVSMAQMAIDDGSAKNFKSGYIFPDGSKLIPPTGNLGNDVWGSTPATKSFGTVVSETKDTELNVSDTDKFVVWNPSTYTSSGAFPSRFRTDGTYADIKKDVEGLRYDEKASLKQRLYKAGAYGYELNIPTSDGIWGDTDEKALKVALSELKTKNQNRDQPLDLDSFLVQATGAHEQTKRSNSLIALNESGTEVADKQDMIGTLQNWAEKTIGRRLSDPETNEILDITFSKNSQLTPDPVTGALRGNSADKDNYIVGGGPNSSAIGLGKALAATYQLQVTSDFSATPERNGITSEFVDAFKAGLGVKIEGKSDRMLAFHEWARTNQGDGKMFDNVRAVYEDSTGEPTAIIVSFNEGVAPPDMTAVDFAFGQQGDDVTRFLAAAKRPGGFKAYANWDGEQPTAGDGAVNRRGAYELSDQIWQFYADKLGFDPNNHEPSTQDRVARAYATDLWNRHGDWTDVALAFHGTDAMAWQRSNDRAYQGDGYQDSGLIPSDIMARARTTVSKMPEWQSLLDPEATKNAYAQKWGVGVAKPILSDPYASMPQTSNGASAKMIEAAQRAHYLDVKTADILQAMSQMASKYNLSPYSGG